MLTKTVTKRTTGFGREFPYLAETTVQTEDGTLITATGMGHTPEAATLRAMLDARSKAAKGTDKKDLGFAPSTLVDTSHSYTFTGPVAFAA